MDFFWVGVGLALLGYFIGDGLKNFRKPKGSYAGYPTLIKENELSLYLGLSREEVNELLSKYPDAPKIELQGTTYFPKQHFLEWLASKDIYKH